MATDKINYGEENDKNKRKRETETETDELNKEYFESMEPAQKRQRVTDSNINILNDDDFIKYEQDEDDEDDEEDEEEEGEEEEEDIDLNTYKTPMIKTKLFNSLNTNNRNNISLLSSSYCSIYSPSSSNMISSESENDENNINLSSSIYGISENSLSILYQFLTFNDILQISKSCCFFWNLSFKLISHLNIKCKSIDGVDEKQINRLISRCSFYLKYLNLSNIASIISDYSLNKISLHCDQLIFISFHSCYNITNKSLINLLNKCQWIKELDISGCYKITSLIGESLSLCKNLKSFNMAWCTEINTNIIPYLLYLNINYSLKTVNLHCINKYITIYPSFQYIFECGTFPNHFKLKNKLFIIGGLQKKTMNDMNLIKHINYLKTKGIEYTDPEILNLRSISEYDFKYKLNLLLKSKYISSGYRLYTVNKTDKIYMIIITEYGVFGTKLIPDKDFQSPRNDFIAALQQSGRNPIEFLKNDCNLNNWDWIDAFQSKRTLSLLGMHKNANWIKYTAIKQCYQINTFINTNNNKENINTQNIAITL